MKPLETGNGVIGPSAAEPVAAVQQAQHAQPTVLDALQASPAQAILDLPLPQLPDDLPPIEPPAFVLSRKITEDAPAATALPAGLPGLSGGQPVDANAILTGAAAEVNTALGTANHAINQAITPAVQATQQAVAQAQQVLGGASAAATPAPAGTPAAVPNVPALPSDPVGALMNGLQLPAIPGVDQLMKPILDLLNSFGTGVLGALNPAQLLSQSSKVVELAMQVGKGSMQTVEQLWQSQAARDAQVAAQKANTDGTDTSQRGFDMAALTERAAEVVQRGNAQLTGVATSFATQAAALAPVILTPPAQATLLASATEHLGQAVGIVNATRGELGGHTAQLNGLVQQMLGQSGLPAPQEVAAAAAKNIGEPLLNQAKQAAQSATDTATKAAGLDKSTSTPGTTTPSSVAPSTTPGSPSANGLFGAPGGRSGMPGGGRPGLSGAPGLPSSPRPSGLPGSSAPGLRAPGLTEPAAALRGGAPGTGTGAPGSSFMGAPAAAGAGGRSDDEHARNVQPYQSRQGNDDLTGPLGESTPDVIGATHPDELVGSDYEQDQF